LENKNNEIESFYDFGLDQDILDSIDALGFTNPTPIQKQAIPVVLNGNDIIGCAQTGTGKTAAYLLPIMNKIVHESLHDSGSVDALIIVPTRELAVQIDQQVLGMSYFTAISSVAVYGGGDGDSFVKQQEALKKGADIVIGTPGRIIAHLNLGYVKIKGLKFLVLDEADRMLDMGFYDDILKIISYLPKERQNLLFSATMPPKIRTLAKNTLNDPVEINIAVSKTAKGVLQGAYMIHDEYKINLVTGLLKGKEEILKSVIIFASTKIKVQEIYKTLKKHSMAVEAIHSDLEQSERENVMREFRNRAVQILVATDIVSRGIDINNISMVLNYDVPQDPEDYIHRVGRTARADSKGLAITFINKDDINRFHRIEKLLGFEIKKVTLPEYIGTGPNYTLQSQGRGNKGKKGGGGGRRRR